MNKKRTKIGSIVYIDRTRYIYFSFEFGSIHELWSLLYIKVALLCTHLVFKSD